jgi:uncharacterized membrane protein YagU involved in acid resistance
MWLHFIDFVGEFVSIPNKHDIYDFYRDHGWIAFFIAFILFVIIIAFLASIFRDVFHELMGLKGSAYGKLVIVALLVVCVALAIWSEVEVPRLLEPRPVFITNQTSFVVNRSF